MRVLVHVSMVVALLSVSGCNCGGSTLKVNAPRIEVEPLSLDFGPVPVGLSANLPVEVRNVGLKVLTLELTDSDTADFSGPTDPVTIAPGARLSVELTFAPTAEGQRNGVVHLLSDADNDVDVAVTVTGIGMPRISGGPGCIKGSSQPCFSGDPLKKGKGACTLGIQYCIDDEVGGSTWTDCIGSGVSSPETCDGADNDCDDVIDNGCACTTGQSQGCSTACGAGTQMCTAGSWSSCSAPLPKPETCDGLDNDCDGKVDNGCPVCAAGVADAGTCTNLTFAVKTEQSCSLTVCAGMDGEGTLVSDGGTSKIFAMDRWGQGQIVAWCDLTTISTLVTTFDVRSHLGKNPAARVAAWGYRLCDPAHPLTGFMPVPSWVHYLGAELPAKYQAHPELLAQDWDVLMFCARGPPVAYDWSSELSSYVRDYGKGFLAVMDYSPAVAKESFDTMNAITLGAGIRFDETNNNWGTATIKTGVSCH